MTLHTPPAQPRRLRLIRALPLATFLVALCTVITTRPAAAQTAQTERHGDHRAQAALHIQAQIVPVAYTPSERRPERAPGSAIIYALPDMRGAMMVVEEIRIVSRGEIVAWIGDRAVQAAVLKTLTVVPQ
jgi:hypothetical protein